MCDFKKLRDIRNVDEVQPLIDRVIFCKSESFTYESISEEIQDALSELEVSEPIKKSFQVDNMIMDTLTQMSDQGTLENRSGIYAPVRMSRQAYA